MKEGAWINGRTGKFSWVTEHASWIQVRANADSIGLPDSIYERVAGMKWDFNGQGREEILLVVMGADFIRMRGHGNFWTFEFTMNSGKALWACYSFLEDFAGPYTTCRFNNLRTKEQIEMLWKDFKDQMRDDPEAVLRVASAITSARVDQFAIKSKLLRHMAKPIPVESRFVNVFIYLIEELFENRMYSGGHDDQKLADIVRRDLTYPISREVWEREGGKFERSGGLPLEGFSVTFNTNPNKSVPTGQPSPVLYGGGIQCPSNTPAWPHLFFTINGNLTKGEAMKQFDLSSSEYPNIYTVVKHELAHAYDRQCLQELQGAGMTQEEFDQPEVYFNFPAEVRAWTGNLIDEFHQFLLHHEGPVENQLVDPFLRGSRIWSLMNQHLNADNRRRVLHELSRELESQKGRANAKPTPQMDSRGPVGR